MTRANELATKRRRFTAECKARAAMEALRGDRTIQANRGQAPKCIRTRPAVRSAKPGIGWVHSLVVVASGSLQVGLIDLLPSDEGSRRSKSSQKRRRFTEARGWSMSLPPRPDQEPVSRSRASWRRRACVARWYGRGRGRTMYLSRTMALDGLRRPLPTRADGPLRGTAADRLVSSTSTTR